jgi:hypothetical protein
VIFNFVDVLDVLDESRRYVCDCFISLFLRRPFFCHASNLRSGNAILKGNVENIRFDSNFPIA